MATYLLKKVNSFVRRIIFPTNDAGIIGYSYTHKRNLTDSPYQYYQLKIDDRPKDKT